MCFTVLIGRVIGNRKICHHEYFKTFQDISNLQRVKEIQNKIVFKWPFVTDGNKEDHVCLTCCRNFLSKRDYILIRRNFKSQFTFSHKKKGISKIEECFKKRRYAISLSY